METNSESKAAQSYQRFPKRKNRASKESVHKLAVLFTDIVGSTKYFKNHGDLAGRRMLREHQKIASSPIIEHGGVVVKTVGDSIMAYFHDPQEAVKSAIMIQHQFYTYNKGRDADDQIHVRIGIHYGDGIVEQTDIFGNVVNLAAKIVPLVEGDQVYISQAVYAQIQDLPSTLFEFLEELENKKDLKGIKIYRLRWEETVKFDPPQNTLLYLRPLWNLCPYDFHPIWERMLKEKERLWGGKIKSEHLLRADVVLIIKEEAQVVEVTREVLAYLKKRVEIGHQAILLPLQILIDSGLCYRAGQFVFDGKKIKWDKIDPGKIHISQAAYELIGTKYSLATEPPFNPDKIRSYYTLKTDEEPTPIFLYQSALIQGDHPFCYYCGDKRHAAAKCPSKSIGEITDAIKKLGYLPLKKINRLFYHFLIQSEAMKEDEEVGGEDTGVPERLAYDGFYELNQVFQLRFFKTIWDSKGKNWNKIKEKKTGVYKRGAAWLAYDCIRISNLKQAEIFLKQCSGEISNDYRTHCTRALFEVERHDFVSALQNFDQALDAAETKLQKIFILLLIYRLYAVKGDWDEAQKKINEILFLDVHNPEAMYRRVICEFKKGNNETALERLTKLIEDRPEYFIVALIDPEIAPHQTIIQPELEKLFQIKKESASQVIPKAEAKLKRLKTWMGDEDESVVKAESLLANIHDLTASQSYLGYIDIIRDGDWVVSICQASAEQHRRMLYATQRRLNARCQKLLTFAANSAAKLFGDSNYRKILDIQRELHNIRSMIDSEDLAGFQNSDNRMKQIMLEIDEMGGRLKRQDYLGQICYFLFKLFKKNLVLQSINLLIGLIFSPLLNHYLGFFFPDLKSLNQDLWIYQKGFLFSGAIICFSLALYLTRKDINPK